MPGQGRRPTKPIYVELSIRTDPDTLWELTQRPWHHQRWDGRFSRIDYLNSPSEHPPEPGAEEKEREESEPVGFRYLLGPAKGPALTGSGVATAERRRADGQRVSALRFASDSGWSPLQEGAGYWRYLPSRSEDPATDGTSADGEPHVTFVTGYDYRSWRWRGGAQLDCLLVRPVVGWLTAWSFDRLRLWAERGISPERALWHGLAEVAVRAGAAALAGVVDAAVTGQAVAGVLTAGVVLVFSALVPPSPVTPAARRCRRRPRPGARGRATARAPRLLAALAPPSDRPAPSPSRNHLSACRPSGNLGAITLEQS
ncbi:hypothetical protein [Kitasatospora griseola]|uniref:hypothetical protein n=1 Tax=Kitasatospora griseola TaxID=2064 RepID=UPI00069905C6|nr:hypothetical protein [Kitasatospora griseola]